MIFLGSDHAGYALKEKIKAFLEGEGFEVQDETPNYVEGDDYPDTVSKAAFRVAETPQNKGIVFGGSGQGEAIVSNKIPGVRCMTFYGPMKPVDAVDAQGRKENDPFEIVRLSRKHNDANILSIGARFVDVKTAKKAVKIWLETEFEGGRHERRVDKIKDLDD